MQLSNNVKAAEEAIPRQIEQIVEKLVGWTRPGNSVVTATSVGEIVDGFRRLRDSCILISDSGRSVDVTPFRKSWQKQIKSNVSVCDKFRKMLRLRFRQAFNLQKSAGNRAAKKANKKKEALRDHFMWLQNLLKDHDTSRAPERDAAAPVLREARPDRYFELASSYFGAGELGVTFRSRFDDFVLLVIQECDPEFHEMWSQVVAWVCVRFFCSLPQTDKITSKTFDSLGQLHLDVTEVGLSVSAALPGAFRSIAQRLRPQDRRRFQNNLSRFQGVHARFASLAEKDRVAGVPVFKSKHAASVAILENFAVFLRQAFVPSGIAAASFMAASSAQSSVDYHDRLFQPMVHNFNL